MSSSGVVTFTVNESDIYTDVLEDIGALGVGESLQPEDVATCRRKLNMIVKQWGGNSDYAPGFKMWTRKRATVFLQKDQVAYALGPTGDNATATYITTTLTTGAALGASTITLASAAGITDDMYIGVLLTTGAFQWTTVNGAPAGAVVTLTDVLTAAAAAGARVFTYTTKMRRPLTILTSMLKDTDGQEQFVDPKMLLEEYQALSDKTIEGTPNWAYYEAQLDNGMLYLNRSPDDVTKVLSLVYLSPIEDFTALEDTADFPQEYYRALCAQLALDIAIPFGVPVTQEMKLRRDEALAIARNSFPQYDRSQFEPNADGEA